MFIGPDDPERARTELIRYIKQSKNIGTPLTIFYMTPTPRAYGAGAEWGTYSMPSIPPIPAEMLEFGARKNHPFLAPNPYAENEKRQTTQEKPLEEDPATFAPVESTTTPNTLLAASPLPGILPACYPSLASCNDITRNCTGHGACSLKYTDNSPDPPKKCYACSCSPTVRTTDGKTQTTYWGGPACQKRDVSMQFWLIALFSVGMVGLISFAIGQVMSMGGEELPSVIGAGVSGPVAKR